MNRSVFDTSLPNQVADANALLQTIDTAQSTTSDTNTPADSAVTGFGAGVHQYLNQLLALVYSKTTTLVAANMILVSLLLSTRTSIKIGLDGFYIGAVFFFSLSAIISTIVLFPRLRHADTGGLIFWKAILLEGSADRYYGKIQELTKASVEEEYARDNYHLAKVIRLKDSLLRMAITFFIVGLSCGVIGVVWPILFSHR